MKLTLNTNVKKVAAKISQLSQRMMDESRKEVKQVLEARIVRLKSELDFLVNQYQKSGSGRDGISTQPLAQKIAEEQALGKSRAVTYGDSFYTGFESPTYKAALVNGGNNYAMRVRDDSIHPDATYEDYRNSFSQTLVDKVFAIQDGMGGGYRYYIIPPGDPLLDEVLDGVKIFCSSYTDSAGMGRDDGDPLQDIGVKEGRRKFNRDRDKGFTEFTLKENSIRAIKEKGQDVTDIVVNTQHGEYEDAYSISKKINSPALKNARERAEQAVEGKNISEEAAALANTNKTITSMGLTEKSSKDSIQYLIKAVLNNRELIAEEVVHAIKREALIWSSETEGPLKMALQQALEKAVKEFNKGS